MTNYPISEQFPYNMQMCMFTHYNISFFFHLKLIYFLVKIIISMQLFNFEADCATFT